MFSVICAPSQAVEHNCHGKHCICVLCEVCTKTEEIVGH